MRNKRCEIRLNLPVTIDRDTLAEHSYSEALEFILAVDIARADSEFTYDLILRLAASLSEDLNAEQYAELVEDIREARAP